MDGKYVFISYKVEEYDAAKAVKDHLEENAIPCWMAPMSIKGGMSYAQEIPPAIKNCGVFLSCCCKATEIFAEIRISALQFRVIYGIL